MVKNRPGALTMNFKLLNFSFFFTFARLHATHMQILLERTVDGFNAEKEHIHKGLRNGMSTVDYFTNFAIFSRYCRFF